MHYRFDVEESQKITERFGSAFFDKVQKDLEFYSSKWDLQVLELVNYFSVNCIFMCRSDRFGDVVLKIGQPCRESFTEFHALREYNGRRFCSILDADIDNGIILEERIQPGIRLRDESSTVKRLLVFTDLCKGLHQEPDNPAIYPTYVGWVRAICEYMSKRDDYRELSLLMKEAEDICQQISHLYTGKMLLHGDLHHDNILLGNHGEYRIIDPKGVIGDPVFDIPRFILNEYTDGIPYEENYERICSVISYLEARLSIPSKIIKQCFFVEMTMAHCWQVEDNAEPDMQSVILAKNIMRS